MERDLKAIVVGAVGATVLSATGFAQHHVKKDGSIVVRPATVQEGQMRQSMQTPGQPGGMGLGIGDNSTMFMSDAQRTAFAQNNPQLSKMSDRNADIWARSIHHSDGTHTESKEDNRAKTLTQLTKKGETVIQRRVILLDERKQPSEIMIYDGRGNFKYRGTQIYDRMGRFAEEQIFDPEEKLIRRRIQEYAPSGEKLPLRSVDYVENIPDDLKLVITRESEAEPATAQAPETAPEKRGFFGNQNRSAVQPVQATAAPPMANPSQETAANSGQQAAAKPEKRKGLNLGRLFSGSRDK